MIILSLMFVCFYIKRQFQLKLKVGVLAHSPILPQVIIGCKETRAKTTLEITVFGSTMAPGYHSQ